MWDVVWTDPDRELVGEHRAKKGKDDQKKGTPSSRSGRVSVSTTSSRSSIDLPFSLFRSRGLRRINTASTNSPTTAQMASSVSPGLESPTKISTRSSPSRSLESTPKSFDRAAAGIFERHVDSPPSASPGKSVFDISRTPSNNDSVFSTLPADITATSSIDDGSMTDFEKVRSIIQMLEDAVPPPEEAQRCETSMSASRPEALAQVDESPTRRSHWQLPLRSPLRLAPKRHTPVMPNNPDAWRPCKQWDAVSSEPPHSPTELLRSPVPTSPMSPTHNPASLSATSLREEVQRMAETEPTVLLARLCELWKQTRRMKPQQFTSSNVELAEMRRWMLSTLNNLDPEHDNRGHESPVTASAVLVLYESWATMTYLAALHPSKQFHHMSATHDLRDVFPNIRSIPVAAVSPDDFPVGPGVFETVYALTLASQCPLAILPSIFSRVHASLKTGGALHLTLVDPLPRTGTMGPRMRAWLEGHLLHNLAKQGLCVSPSTAFPHMLGEVGLRGKGSVRTTTKFYAMPQSARGHGNREDVGDVQADRLEVEAQVRSLVGRMLWVEVWGAHVTGDVWWWEDEGCVRECLEMGTFWECHTILGVKEVKGED